MNQNKKDFYYPFSENGYFTPKKNPKKDKNNMDLNTKQTWVITPKISEARMFKPNMNPKLKDIVVKMIKKKFKKEEIHFIWDISDILDEIKISSDKIGKLYD